MAEPEPSQSPDRARLDAAGERARASAARASAQMMLSAGAVDVAPRDSGPLSLGLSQGQLSFKALLPAVSGDQD